jgi:threonine synthase
VTPAQLEAWEHLSYPALAFNVLRLYIPEAEIPSEDLQRLVNKSYSTFRHEDVVPVVQVRPSVSGPPPPHLFPHCQMSDDCSLLVMEQFHGPTCAFKDVALQFVGNMFEFFLARKARAVAAPDAGILCDPDTPSHITVVGATSGDTGSAAIEGLRGKANIECVPASDGDQGRGMA